MEGEGEELGQVWLTIYIQQVSLSFHVSRLASRIKLSDMKLIYSKLAYLKLCLINSTN